MGASVHPCPNQHQGLALKQTTTAIKIWPKPLKKVGDKGCRVFVAMERRIALLFGQILALDFAKV